MTAPRTVTPEDRVYTFGVSDEPLESIRLNECEASEGLATSRFRRLWNEIESLRAERAQATAAERERLCDLADAEAWRLAIAYRRNAERRTLDNADAVLYGAADATCELAHALRAPIRAEPTSGKGGG